MTAVVSILAAFLIVDWPEQCRFLDASEKDLLRRRLEEDGVDEARMDTLNPFAYGLILRDWKIWLSSLVYMGIGTSGYALTFFMPTILLEFGWTAEMAQIYTIPVYAFAAAGMLLAAYLSDRLRHRYGFILGGAIISTVGYIMLLEQQAGGGLSRQGKYAAVFLVALGGYTGTPMALAWLANNVSGHWKRAFSSGIQVTLGNMAGIIGSNIFVQTEAPYYKTGYGTALAMTWVGVCAATVLFVGLLVENRKRERGDRDDRLVCPEEEVGNMGDWHPSFRFTL